MLKQVVFNSHEPPLRWEPVIPVLESTCVFCDLSVHLYAQTNHFQCANRRQHPSRYNIISQGRSGGTCDSGKHPLVFRVVFRD